jgi:uncharacterized linocin/CFP29 family protein
MDYLHRSSSHFPAELWDAIDQAVSTKAAERLTARRFLDIEGPFGTGIAAVEIGQDDQVRPSEPAEADVIMGRSISVPMLRRRFHLSVRRIAAHLDYDQPLDLRPAEDAGEAVADREEELIYRGLPDFRLEGLLTCAGRHQIAGGDWSAIDRALQDVLAGVTLLDQAGYRGPYALALSPPLYNGLFRLYPGTDTLQVEHLRRLCTRGIYKAPIEGGVLVDPNLGVLLIGQDLMTGYISQDGAHFHLFAGESLVLRIDEPEAICTISAHTRLAEAAKAER